MARRGWAARAGSLAADGPWHALPPDEYLRWVAPFLWSGPPLAYLHRRFPVLRGAADDVLNSCYLALATTAANKVERQETFSFNDQSHAEAFTNRAVRNSALLALRARGSGPASTSLDAVSGADAWPALDASFHTASGAGSSGPPPADPQVILDRVQAAVRDAVRTDDRYDCPSCGQGDLVNLTLGVIEEARDELDVVLAPAGTAEDEPVSDAFDAITRTTPAGRSVYRAIARAKGDDYVFDASSGIEARAKTLLRRCRPCVERIVDDVIAWIVVAPEDWTGEHRGELR